MKTSKIAYTFFLVATQSAVAQSTSGTGSIEGSVTDVDGRALAGAEVYYQRAVKTVNIGRRPVPAPGEAVAMGTVTADAGGDFLVPGLPAGNYGLCASVPSSPYLDPCIWQQGVEAAVSAGGATIRTLVLTKGVYLKVRVNDPEGLLPRTVDGIWTPRKLLVGVTYANGAYQGAENTGADAAGRDYQMTIPAGLPFSLRVFSLDVALADAAGNKLDMSGVQMIPFQAAGGQD